ncbi:DUF6270 domain-containing protein [Terrilactibacillus laevilacticus]|uniref:DUF6270 domain-containing protein n=1 Tax=Terrilactibacillus laevilacticus TaxID=1380157 RepID=UPI003CCC529E
MGTCFSRNAFNSSNYFNPGYKEVFDCVFTQFHSSIISLMTEPVSFNLDKYTDLTINEKGFVNADFNKTFFDNLISSKADYLIIDLYCDAIRPLIWINNKQAVTLSYLVENSKLLNDLNIQSILDHLDNDKYFNIWKMYLDKFVERLIKIIPSERIILNMGRFALEYYDNERKKSKYPNAMMIKRNNYFWDKLDNYFLAKVPDAKVLDIQKYPLIGDVKYPYGHSFSHYESNYYKLFLKELALLILRDRLNS